jgi:hypothetical protein
MSRFYPWLNVLIVINIEPYQPGADRVVANFLGAFFCRLRTQCAVLVFSVRKGEKLSGNIAKQDLTPLTTFRSRLKERG